jgi:hypothetical protein
MPFHRLLDVLEENRLADRKYGSTRRASRRVCGQIPEEDPAHGRSALPGHAAEKLLGIVGI